MRSLNLDQLRTLLAVSECGSFSAAAHRLHLTQPAVSQQVKELESRLGVVLLERVGRRTEPTPAGRELLEHARDLLDRADATLTVMEHHRLGKLGRVRFGADATLCAFVLPPILRGLLKAHPSIEMILEAGPSSELLHRVATNDLDIALVTRPPVIEPILETETVLRNTLLAFWPDTFGPAPDVLTPRDFHGRPFIGYKPGRVTHTLVQAWLQAADCHPGPVLSIDMGVTIPSIVASGLGASILPPEVAVYAEMLGTVSVRPLDPPIPRTVVCVMRRDKRRTPALRVLSAALSGLSTTG